MKTCMLWTRGEFLITSAAAIVALMAPLRGLCGIDRRVLKTHKREKKLWLHNTHTGETVRETFWVNGKMQPTALKAIHRGLRDHRTGEVTTMDPKLLLLMCDLQILLDHRKPFDIISGYRCQRTNARLRKAGRGVAKESYHTKGKAVDIQFRGLTLQRAYKAVCHMRKGGVGLYPQNRFVHMDTRGQYVTWQGA